MVDSRKWGNGSTFISSFTETKLGVSELHETCPCTSQLKFNSTLFTSASPPPRLGTTPRYLEIFYYSGSPACRTQTGLIFLSLFHYLSLSCYQLSSASPRCVRRVSECPLVGHHLGQIKRIHFFYFWWLKNKYHIILSLYLQVLYRNPFKVGVTWINNYKLIFKNIYHHEGINVSSQFPFMYYHRSTFMYYRRSTDLPTNSFGGGFGSNFLLNPIVYSEDDDIWWTFNYCQISWLTHSPSSWRWRGWLSSPTLVKNLLWWC